VREAVTDYDERSMHGGLPVLADLDATSKRLWVHRRRLRAAAAVLRRSPSETSESRVA
jgi:hypothetical protein